MENPPVEDVFPIEHGDFPLSCQWGVKTFEIWSTIHPDRSKINRFGISSTECSPKVAYVFLLQPLNSFCRENDEQMSSEWSFSLLFSNEEEGDGEHHQCSGSVWFVLSFDLIFCLFSRFKPGLRFHRFLLKNSTHDCSRWILGWASCPCTFLCFHVPRTRKLYIVVGTSGDVHGI